VNHLIDYRLSSSNDFIFLSISFLTFNHFFLSYKSEFCGVGIVFNASIGGVRMLDGVVTDSDTIRIISISTPPRGVQKTTARRSMGRESSPRGRLSMALRRAERARARSMFGPRAMVAEDWIIATVMATLIRSTRSRSVWRLRLDRSHGILRRWVQFWPPFGT